MHFFSSVIWKVHDLSPFKLKLVLLFKNGILENWLPDDNDAVSSPVHNLSWENSVDSNNFYFSGVVEDMNKHSRKRGHKWKAALKQSISIIHGLCNICCSSCCSSHARYHHTNSVFSHSSCLIKPFQLYSVIASS